MGAVLFGQATSKTDPGAGQRYHTLDHSASSLDNKASWCFDRLGSRSTKRTITGPRPSLSPLVSPWIFIGRHPRSEMSMQAKLILPIISMQRSNLAAPGHISHRCGNPCRTVQRLCRTCAWRVRSLYGVPDYRLWKQIVGISEQKVSKPLNLSSFVASAQIPRRRVTSPLVSPVAYLGTYLGVSAVAL